MNWENRIEQLKGEMYFHSFLSKKDKLVTRLEIRLKPVEERYNEFVGFRDSLEEIRSVLYTVFKEILTKALPPISSIMTEVYKRLTKQVSFDLVQLELDEKTDGFSPKILVRVASSDDPELQPLNPEQVLNGQALNALRLVPYFVFSRFQIEAWGLDLLLLDDPTQSFDVKRIELLLDELGRATSHAQLIISSHEEECFIPLLPRFFKEDNINIINVNGFNKNEGPKIEIR